MHSLTGRESQSQWPRETLETAARRLHGASFSYMIISDISALRGDTVPIASIFCTIGFAEHEMGPKFSQRASPCSRL
jgi:hypothetical protein